MSNNAFKEENLLSTNNIKMPPNNPKIKIINYLGKIYKYRNIVELSKKLNISRPETRELLKQYREGSFIKYVMNENTNTLTKIDLRQKPTLLRSFGINKPRRALINKALITNTPYKNFKISNKINSSTPIKLVFKITFTASISELEDVKDKTFLSNWRGGEIEPVSPNQISDILIYSYIFDYMPNIEEGTITDVSYEIISAGSNIEFKLNDDYELYDENALDIKELYNETIDNKNGDCVRDYIKNNFKRTSKKYIDKMRTISDIYNFAVKYDVKMLCYDIRGTIQKAYYPKTNKNKMKNIIFIAHNNHLYPLKNEILRKTKPKKDIPYKFIEDTNDKFLNIIKKDKAMPKYVNFTVDREKGIYISGFTYKDVVYHNNRDYDIILKLLTSYGLADYMTPFTNRNNVAKIIEKLYLQKTNEKTKIMTKINIDSYLPPNSKFIKGGFNYINENVLETTDEINDIITMDKCKAYSYALKDLDFLIKCDIRNTEIYTDNINKFTPHYLYIVKPNESSILLPNTNIYSGEYMNKVKENTTLKFKVLEYIHCEKVENVFKQFIIDLYEKCKELKDLTLAKNIVNIHIGKMEAFTERKQKFKIEDGIYNEKTIKNEDGNFMGNYVEIFDRNKYDTNEYNSGYFLKIIQDETIDIYNRKPISVQVKDHTRWILYEKMCDLGLKDKDIIQVKTDSISFKKRKGINYMKYIDAHNIDKWKLECFSKLKCGYGLLDNVGVSFQYENDGQFNGEINELGNCYAGSGKTYHIVNNIIPNLNKYINDKLKNSLYEEKEIDVKNDYIVLSPQHSCIKEYRKLGINCNVSRAYDFKLEYPKEKVIIVDEIGMLNRSAWNMLCKSKLKGKIIIGYGDFRQLIPVDKFKVKNHFLKYFFTDIIQMNTNYRNEFTTDYYDNLIKSNNTKYLVDEIMKHSEKDYRNADVIITYTNKTRMKYNKLMAKHKGFKDKKDVGVKCILLSNELKDMEIYNKYEFTVVEADDEFITVNDDLKDYKIPIEKYEEYFDYGYCRTIYSIQGESIPKYFWTNTVADNKYINGVVAYTIISRKKTK